ncbi:MAG: RNA polymerase subunit sigma-24 [Kaistia sp. SCN 65-12]|nr:MAG: RNA polymerase subunit sigma-24 [Kaistia sp. SCN 65-12]
MPPTELIASARDGDAAAIASLLAVAQPDIRRYARITCRTADVDDAVQDALCLLHRHIGSLRAVSAFSGWLFAVVRRECLRLARHGFGQAAPLDIVEDRAEIATRPDHELRLDLTAAIQSLPAHYREVLVLRDLEELTIDEIAARLETTRETVKARLRRARMLAREYLAR